MNKSNGFSLVELLIVIAVIGIFGSFLFPNFTSVQDKAKESAVKAVAHAVQIALETHFVGEGSYPVGTNVTLSELGTTLVASGGLAAVPENPFTGSAYTATDGSGKILYNHTRGETDYEITVFGEGNSSTILTLTNGGN